MVCLRYDPPGLDDPFCKISKRSKLTHDEISKYLDISPRTLKRWIENDSAPLMARKLLLLVHGDLGSLWPVWEGWRFCGYDLWTPEDVPYNQGDIQALFWYRQQIRGLKIDLREAQKKAELIAQPSAEIIPFRHR